MKTLQGSRYFRNPNFNWTLKNNATDILNVEMFGVADEPPITSTLLRYLIGGVWKEITEVSVLISGTWRTASEIYVLISGVWKKSI